MWSDIVIAMFVSKYKPECLYDSMTTSPLTAARWGLEAAGRISADRKWGHQTVSQSDPTPTPPLLLAHNNIHHTTPHHTTPHHTTPHHSRLENRMISYNKMSKDLIAEFQSRHYVTISSRNRAEERQLNSA